MALSGEDSREDFLKRVAPGSRSLLEWFLEFGRGSVKPKKGRHSHPPHVYPTPTSSLLFQPPTCTPYSLFYYLVNCLVLVLLLSHFCFHLAFCICLRGFLQIRRSLLYITNFRPLTRFATTTSHAQPPTFSESLKARVPLRSTAFFTQNRIKAVIANRISPEKSSMLDRTQRH